MTTVASFDLCQDGSFDTSSGEWSFETSDKVAYPPGVYTMQLTGSIEENSSVQTSINFQVKLVDPCVSAQVSMLFAPFEDQVMFYFDDQITFYYEILAEQDTSFDCGAYAIDFADADGQPLDPSLFSDGSEAFDLQGSQEIH